MKKNRYFLLFCFFLLVLINFLFIFWDYLTSPLNCTKIIFIRPGWSFKKVVNELKQQKILHCPLFFWTWGIIKGVTTKIKPGEYLIKPNITPLELLENFVNGKCVIKYKIVIPEGATIKQIAKILAKKGLIDEDKFLKLAYNPNFVQNLGIKSKSIEGYLFPTTYFLAKGLSEKKIIEIMVKEFKKIYKKYAKKAKQKNLSCHEVVTLASIVEKETSISEEKPLIASVFLNRLHLDMPLQADPTVIYALPKFNGKLKKEDLKYPSPYNTYLIKGLPPTPICSPGEEAIKAVVNAPKTSYLYFVAKGNGRHHFSRTLKEHIMAINKYRKNN